MDVLIIWFKTRDAIQHTRQHIQQFLLQNIEPELNSKQISESSSLVVAVFVVKIIFTCVIPN